VGGTPLGQIEGLRDLRVWIEEKLYVRLFDIVSSDLLRQWKGWKFDALPTHLFGLWDELQCLLKGKDSVKKILKDNRVWAPNEATRYSVKEKRFGITMVFQR